jgi:hypothetical protein
MLMQQTINKTIYQGMGIGSTLAMMLSWQHNASITWSAIHGLCGWLYVVFYAVKTGRL